MEKASQYVMIDYANSSPNPYPHGLYPQTQQYGGYFINNYLPYNYSELGYPHHYLQPQQQQYLYSYDYQPVDQANELNQLKRSLGCLNLVHTRKNDKDRYQ
jgi:hypothetical protein